MFARTRSDKGPQLASRLSSWSGHQTQARRVVSGSRGTCRAEQCGEEPDRPGYWKIELISESVIPKPAPNPAPVATA
jgi:hypothetical protein